MTTQIAVPVFCYAAPKIHQLNHTVTDATPGFICTETTGADSFSQNSVIRCKEIRCDRNGGKVRTTGLIVSNKNQVQSGQIVSDSAIYDDVGGVTTPKIITFDNTINNSALVVRSGGAFIGDGANVDGTLTATQVNVTGTSSFAGLVTANAGISIPNQSQQIVQASTKVITPEIDTGSATNLLLKRNSNTVALLESNCLTINTQNYLKYHSQPRFCVQLNYNHTATSASALINWGMVHLNHPTNHFAVANGRFTAPVSGHYRFSAVTYSQASTLPIELTLQVNDANPSGVAINVIASNTAGYKTISLNCILYIAANEYVTLVTNTNGVYTSKTAFAGELISIT